MKVPVGVLAAGLLLTASALEAQPAISFADAEVVVEGLAPGSSVALVAVERRPRPWSVEVIPRAELLLDEDLDGRIVYAVETDLSPAAIWAAVDLGSGAFSAAAPEGFDATEVGIDLAAALLAGDSGLPDTFLWDHSNLQLFAARPGVGAWHAAGSDAGPADLGAPDDGAVLLDLAAAPPVGETDLPFGLATPGDVFIGMDPDTLEFFQVGLAEE